MPSTDDAGGAITPKVSVPSSAKTKKPASYAAFDMGAVRCASRLREHVFAFGHSMVAGGPPPAPENNRRALRVETCDSVGDDAVTPQPRPAQRTQRAAETAKVVGEGGGPYGRTMFRRALTSMLDLVRLHHAQRRVRSVFGLATTMLR